MKACLRMAACALGLFAAALAPAFAVEATDVKPDLSGKDPRWIEDKVAHCWAGNPHPQPNEAIYWSGACDQNHLVTGEGTLTWLENGQITGRDVGTFKNGIMTGHGKISAVDGTSYEGDFPGTGVLTLPDGRKVPARSVREPSGWTIEEPVPGVDTK
jgi:hypothetical protein